MRRDIERHWKPRICFVGYRHIREFASPVLAEYAADVDVVLLDGTFDGAVNLARERAERGEVDAFVSAGSNAALLRRELAAPVATIQVTGFDLLQALIRAKEMTGRVGVVTYGNVIPELDAVKGLLNIQIVQHAYETFDDARQRIKRLQEAGFNVIVGSSLVVELAEEFGMNGLLAYSLDSVRRGFDDAIELARVARLEASRYERLNGVLHTLPQAVLAVDLKQCITMVNPPMQRLLGREESELLRKPLTDVEPSLSLTATLSSGLEEGAAIQRLGQRDWVAHRSPIREQGEIVGAVLMLNDAVAVEAAETVLRIQQRRRQPTIRHTFKTLVGESPAMRIAVEAARRYATTDHTVLITGESGTGKELFAQAIHSESRRSAQPFVAVNCAAFPETLLESELFGYEEGAFTGARRGGKRGLIEAAHKGTLFLDEIGDMPMPLQSRLLRFTQEREVTRLGSSTAIPVSVRIVLATHQPLERMVAEGRFRADLFFRVTTLRLPLPPLRERREDVRSLAMHLLQKEGRSNPAALHYLGWMLEAAEKYPWPGNVRELENFCDRLDALHAGRSVQDVSWAALRWEFPELFSQDGKQHADLRKTDDLPMAERVAQAMEQVGHNRKKAAELLGVSRSTLWRWLKASPLDNGPSF